MDTYGGNVYAMPGSTAAGVAGHAVQEIGGQSPTGRRESLAPGPGVIAGSPADASGRGAGVPEWAPRWAPSKPSIDYVQAAITTAFLLFAVGWLAEQIVVGRGGAVRSIGRAKAAG